MLRNWNRLEKISSSYDITSGKSTWKAFNNIWHLFIYAIAPFAVWIEETWDTIEDRLHNANLANRFEIVMEMENRNGNGIEWLNKMISA